MGLAESRSLDVDRAPERARALLGWLSEDDAFLTMLSRRQEGPPDDFAERARQKRLVASVRQPPVGAQSVVHALPRSLRRHAQLAERTPEGTRLLDRGWQAALVDLSRVCAMAPIARADLDLPEVSDDLHVLLDVTMAPAGDARVEAGYDDDLDAWIVRPRSSDLAVVGQFHAAQPAGVVLGLVLGPAPSFLLVEHAGDRYVLVDGYDRAVSLLARGVRVVPAFVRAGRRGRELPFGDSTLRREVVLGRRPPLLPDFLDDDVSAEVVVPRRERLLMVKAHELVHYDTA